MGGWGGDPRFEAVRAAVREARDWGDIEMIGIL